MEPLRVAVIGAGYWGPNLIRNFEACPVTDLRTVCDLDVERAKRVLGRHSTVTATASLDEVLADDAIEAVAVATPARTHLEVVLATAGV